MKKIINPWEGLDGYMCSVALRANPLGLHMEFLRMVTISWRSGSLKVLTKDGCVRCTEVYRLR